MTSPLTPLYGGAAYGTGGHTDASWLPVADVQRQLGVREDNETAVADAELCRKAAAVYVERVRPDLLGTLTDAEGDEVLAFAATSDVVLGAVMLAARLYARKGSPGGLASFGEFGPAALPRLDPDIERLLGLGRHARPAVG